MKPALNILFVLTLATLGSACTGTWEKRASTTMLVASDAEIVCDVSQTLWFADGGKFDHGIHEGNPLLGSNPSTERIVATGLIALAGNTAMYFILPPKWRQWWYASAMVIEGSVITYQPSNPDVTRYGSHHGCDFQQNIHGSSPTGVESAALNTSHNR